MEEEQLGETFQVIEPPFLPEKPVKPNRLAIIIIGFVLAVGFAIGCTALSEFTDKSIQDVQSLEQIIGMRVWSIVPRIMTAADIARVRRKRIVLTTASVLGVLVGVAAFHFMVMDLYIFFAKVDRHVQRLF
jgi:capsular polysaccharide biosynthesis protein